MYYVRVVFVEIKYINVSYLFQMFSNWFVCILIFKLIVAERLRRTTTMEYFDAILKDAPTHCFDITIKANNNGNNNVSYATINIPIPVTHSWMSEAPWKSVRKMERMNLWMNIGRDVRISPNVDPHGFHSSFELTHKQLMYIPGRTIIFDDFNKALLHVGITNFTNDKKAEAIVSLVNKLSKNYDSVVFRQHLDKSLTCNYHCCKEGSQLVQEMVALNGWNDTQCPGHRNLSWDTGSCDCLFTRYC